MLFRVYLFVRLASMRPRSTLATECISEAITFLESAPANFHETSANSRTEVQLKPETIKCYSRQLERAIEIIFACHAPCVLRRKLCNARSRGCGFAAGRRPNE